MVDETMWGNLAAQGFQFLITNKYRNISQFLQFLAKLPGIRSDDAYSVVADLQDT